MKVNNTIDIPPPFEVGILCELLLFGVSIRFKNFEKLINLYVRNIDIKNDEIAMIKELNII